MLIDFVGAVEQSGAYFGQGDGPIHYDHIVCSGMEYNFIECEAGTGTRESSHDEDVGVKCNTSEMKKLDHELHYTCPLCYCQLMTTIVKGTFVWWEAHTTGRVEWRYSGVGHG